MLTVNEVAEHLRLGPDEVRVMIRRGKPPAVKIGSRWRIRMETVETVLRGNSPPAERARRRPYAGFR
jgi:excisionase family DNA binding protein